MAASPGWKVYDAAGEYRAAFKYPEDASFLVAALGDGATCRHGHRVKDIVWTDQPAAAESCDEFARLCRERVESKRTQWRNERKIAQDVNARLHPTLSNEVVEKCARDACASVSRELGVSVRFAGVLPKDGGK